MKTKWIFVVMAVILLLGLVVSLTKDDTPDDGGIIGNIPGVETGTNKDTEGTKDTVSSTETEAPSTVCNHVYGSATIVREATCSLPGLKVSTCTKCGNCKNETIPVTADHSFGEGIEDFEGCGKVINYYCSNCSYIKTVDTGVYVHNYSLGSCSVCGAKDPAYDSGSDNEDPCANGEHDFYTVEEHEGCDYHMVTYCRNCNYVDFGESDFRHSYSSEGNMTHSCSSCGDTESCYSNDDDPLCDVCGAALN